MTRSADERGEYIASSHVLSDSSVCEHRWYLLCPLCGADRSGLLGNAHDFMNDCPRCRGGPTGPTGPVPFISARNARRLAKRRAARGG